MRARVIIYLTDHPLPIQRQISATKPFPMEANLGGTCLFYCDLDWENVSEFYFDAYAFARDSVQCKTRCGLWEFMYNWPS